MQNKTIAYMRISDKKQEQGNGIEQQRLSIMAWSLAANVKVDEWVAETQTGTTSEREEILRLLEEARAGSFSTLVVDRLDRFARKLLVSEKLYAQFTEAGVEVVAATMTLDKTPTGTLVRQMLGSIAEFQRSEWLGRMKQAKAASVARRGGFRGGRVATGYRSVGRGELAVDARGAALVRLSYSLRASGRTLEEICAEVYAQGFRTAKGTRIERGTICKILKREAVYRSEAPAGSPHIPTPGLHPPLLEDKEPDRMHVRQSNC